jgi:hypothetical protein
LLFILRGLFINALCKKAQGAKDRRERNRRSLHYAPSELRSG